MGTRPFSRERAPRGPWGRHGTGCSPAGNSHSDTKHLLIQGAFQSRVLFLRPRSQTELQLATALPWFGGQTQDAGAFGRAQHRQPFTERLGGGRVASTVPGTLTSRLPWPLHAQGLRATAEEALCSWATAPVATAPSFVIPFMMCQHTAPAHVRAQRWAVSLCPGHRPCVASFCGSQCSVPGSFEEV